MYFTLFWLPFIICKLPIWLITEFFGNIHHLLTKKSLAQHPSTDTCIPIFLCDFTWSSCCSFVFQLYLTLISLSLLCILMTLSLNRLSCAMTFPIWRQSSFYLWIPPHCNRKSENIGKLPNNHVSIMFHRCRWFFHCSLLTGYAFVYVFFSFQSRGLLISWIDGWQINSMLLLWEWSKRMIFLFDSLWFLHLWHRALVSKEGTTKASKRSGILGVWGLCFSIILPTPPQRNPVSLVSLISAVVETSEKHCAVSIFGNTAVIIPPAVPKA